MADDKSQDPVQGVLWPNQHDIPDGVTPTEDVPQEADAVDDEDLDLEMEN